MKMSTARSTRQVVSLHMTYSTPFLRHVRQRRHQLALGSRLSKLHAAFVQTRYLSGPAVDIDRQQANYIRWCRSNVVIRLVQCFDKPVSDDTSRKIGRKTFHGIIVFGRNRQPSAPDFIDGPDWRIMRRFSRGSHDHRDAASSCSDQARLQHSWFPSDFSRWKP